MKKKLLFSKIISTLVICLLFSTSTYSQNKEVKRSGFNFKIQGVGLFLFNSEAFDYLEGTTTFNRGVAEDVQYFELAENSRIFGANIEVNYYFNSQIAIGIGTGYESLTQPNIEYAPVYLNILGSLTPNKKTIYGKLNFGTHLGSLDKGGFFSAVE